MSRRRPARVLGLLLCVALVFSGFVANADAKRLSKAKKQAISKKLTRAVKKNPRVVTKRWFLKQASIVNYTLPATIRLLPAKNQTTHGPEYISNDVIGNSANLDLGASLGSRTVGLGGKVQAEINFNDAFDGGNIGDVRINIPSGGSAITSTSVPLLTNHDVSSQTGGQDEVQLIVIGPAATGGTFTLDNSVGPTPNETSAPITFTCTSADAGSIDSALEGTSNIGAGEVYVAMATSCGGGPSGTTVYAVWFTGTLGKTDQPLMSINAGGLTPSGAGSAVSPRTNGSPSGLGCSNFAGDGTPADVDTLDKMSPSTDPGNVNNVGAGPYSPELLANEQDVVLRTGPLTLDVDSPGTTVALPGSTQTHKVGASGGRANLFGGSVNGTGDAVDVTVNLTTNINSIARQVDGAFPGAAGGPDETNGNIAAYFNCRQAWTGYVENHLTGIKLRGGLKISPAITADGKLRIAKVDLSTPSGQEAKVAVAACLTPYQLFADGKAGLGDSFSVAPTLPLGLAAAFNPLAAAETAASSDAPAVPCNSGSGPLDRDPFNVSPIPGLDPLTNGSEVAVSGDLGVDSLKAEVLIGFV